MSKATPNDDFPLWISTESRKYINIPLYKILTVEGDISTVPHHCQKIPIQSTARMTALYLCCTIFASQQRML